MWDLSGSYSSQPWFILVSDVGFVSIISVPALIYIGVRRGICLNPIHPSSVLHWCQTWDFSQSYSSQPWFTLVSDVGYVKIISIRALIYIGVGSGICLNPSPDLHRCEMWDLSQSYSSQSWFTLVSVVGFVSIIFIPDLIYIWCQL